MKRHGLVLALLGLTALLQAQNLEQPAPEATVPTNAPVAERDKQGSPGPYSLRIQPSSTWQGQSYPTTWSGSGPSPDGIEASPLFMLTSIEFHWNIGSQQYLGFALGGFVDEYVWRDDLQRAFPTQIETGSITGPLATVLGLVPRASYGLSLPLSPGNEFWFDLGLSALVRIPVQAIDGSTGIEAIGTYLNKNFKFLYPDLGLGFSFPLSTHLRFGPWARTMIPLSRLWDGENLPFHDTWIVSVGIGLDVQL